MVHVTEENITIIDNDLLMNECLRASEGKSAFAYLVSPFISDYKVPSKVSRFASNIIGISDIENYTDLIRFLCDLGGYVKVLSRSPKNLLQIGASPSFVQKHARMLLTLHDVGCEIRLNSSLHAKATITSLGVVSGSFNLTKSGRFFNLEAGFYFTNTKGSEQKEYMEKLRWVKEIFEKSIPVSRSDLEF